MLSPTNVYMVKYGLAIIDAGNKYYALDNQIAIQDASKDPQKYNAYENKRRIWKSQALDRLSMDDFLPAKSIMKMDFIHKFAFSELRDDAAFDIFMIPFSRGKTWNTALLQQVRDEFQDFSFILDCGAGAFGRVWLVKDLTEQIIALKVIPLAQLSHFEQELNGLKLYRQTIHDFRNLVQIFHVGKTEHFFYYTMEAAYSLCNDSYIPWSLENLLNMCSFNSADASAVTMAILSGLSVLHHHQLAHHDVKPGNIVFINNKPKLCDIGLLSHLSVRDFGGTKEFLPHDLNIEKIVDAGIDCDLFATGKVLYLLLSNNNRISDFPNVSEEILKNPLAKQLNKVIDKACADKYLDRYKSVQEFIDALSKASASSKKLFSHLFE